MSCEVLGNGTVACKKEELSRVDYWHAKKVHLDSMIADSKDRLDKLKVSESGLKVIVVLLGGRITVEMSMQYF